MKRKKIQISPKFVLGLFEIKELSLLKSCWLFSASIKVAVGYEIVKGEVLTLPVVARFGERPSGFFRVNPCFKQSGYVRVTLSPDVQRTRTSITITLSKKEWVIKSSK